MTNNNCLPVVCLARSVADSVRDTILITDQSSSKGAVLVPVGACKRELCFLTAADVTALAPEESARNKKASFVWRPEGCQNPLKRHYLPPVFIFKSIKCPSGIGGAGGGQRANFPVRGPLLQVEMLMSGVQDSITKFLFCL